MKPLIEPESSGGIAILRGGKGRGAPLMLLHGIGSNALSFSPMMAFLCGTREVIAWDTPGYGGSAPLDEEWPSADDYANALSGLLDYLGFSTIDLAGHSMGCLIAGRFAALHPSRVRRLVLASPALGNSTRPHAPLAPSAAARLDGMMSEGAEKFAATRGPRLVFDRGRTDIVAAVTKAMSEIKLPGYAQASRMLSCADLISDAARISAPTLVMAGDHDEITPPANCKRMFDALAAASPQLGHRFELIADAGHAVVQERPDVCAQLVGSYLAAGWSAAKG